MQRRRFLQTAVATTGLALLGSLTALDRAALAQESGNTGYGPLRSADENGLQLPAGFRSRVIATTGETVAGTDHRWHPNPDGGATFRLDDDGWVYVSNDESDDGDGGVSMVHFDRDGRIVDAGWILRGTSRNCAGGPTPWGTWLSCEEFGGGRVWECDPTGRAPATVRPAMGTFSHEAAAADPERRVIYLTEDRSDGLLYRFTPGTWGDLSQGQLDAMTMSGGTIGWAEIPDPTASDTQTRRQLDAGLRFDGGEGAWFGDGRLYFTTKGDNRVWCYDPAANELDVVYDIETSPDPILSGVDNITLSRAGELFVCEDGGNMEVVVLSSDGRVEPFVRMEVDGSEVTGVAFDPSGSRMYVSSQRNPGQTFEISGPFRPPAPAEPAAAPGAATAASPNRAVAARFAAPASDGPR